MKLRYEEKMSGPGPSEAVVVVGTASGQNEEIIVDRSDLEDSFLKVYKIATDGARVLVELPRESVAGNWRIWVTKEQG